MARTTVEVSVADLEATWLVLECGALLEAAVAEALEDDRAFAVTEHGRKLKAASDSFMAASRTRRDRPRVEIRG